MYDQFPEVPSADRFGAIIFADQSAKADAGIVVDVVQSGVQYYSADIFENDIDAIRCRFFDSCGKGCLILATIIYCSIIVISFG